MDHQGRFRRAALALDVPDDEISRFVEHLRLSIRLSGGSGGVPVGRFGGAPRLPVDEDWPSDGIGRLPFVFSVDCAALPRVDGFGLPADGSLLFFLDHENDHLASATGEQGYARVVYVSADTDTAVAEPPDPGFLGKQYDVSATLCAELPDWFSTHEDEEEDDLSPFQQRVDVARPLSRGRRVLLRELRDPPRRPGRRPPGQGVFRDRVQRVETPSGVPTAAADPRPSTGGLHRGHDPLKHLVDELRGVGSSRRSVPGASYPCSLSSAAALSLSLSIVIMS
ncbi:DUF1963 domain-containing protein [Actinocorallia aurantiaca]|uniref:DUF1963 domain-containing protein n=1 Tax=Actinocorallia aurantiaca TaxID=46204 RepID=A0ABN3UQ06_9ACTN